MGTASTNREIGYHQLRNQLTPTEKSVDALDGIRALALTLCEHAALILQADVAYARCAHPSGISHSPFVRIETRRIISSVGRAKWVPTLRHVLTQVSRYRTDIFTGATGHIFLKN